MQVLRIGHLTGAVSFHAAEVVVTDRVMLVIVLTLDAVATLDALALDQGRLLLAMIAIDTVSASLITEVAGVPPLLRSGSSRKD